LQDQTKTTIVFPLYDIWMEPTATAHSFEWLLGTDCHSP
jgi:hypothetical protein